MTFKLGKLFSSYILNFLEKVKKHLVSEQISSREEDSLLKRNVLGFYMNG